MREKELTIGKLSIGKRHTGTHKFCVFYCPLLKSGKKYFHFFWWFGKHWYVALPKSKKKSAGK